MPGSRSFGRPRKTSEFAGAPPTLGWETKAARKTNRKRGKERGSAEVRNRTGDTMIFRHLAVLALQLKISGLTVPRRLQRISGECYFGRFGFLPFFNHFSNSPRLISMSPRTRETACGQRGWEGWQWTPTLAPRRLVT